MKKISLLFIALVTFFTCMSQSIWVNIDESYTPMPASMHVYKSGDSLYGHPNVMYYAIADLHDKKLNFTTDTSFKRRLTPSQFFKKNDHPYLVVNGAFFSFETNQNLNVVVKDGKTIAYNEQNIKGRGKDTFTYYHPFFSAIGIDQNNRADVAWIYSDSSEKFLHAAQIPVAALHDSVANPPPGYIYAATNIVGGSYHGKSKLFNFFKNWKMKTAIGGGPVLVQNSKVRITNNEERKFAGKAINDRHPRTAIGYTRDGKIIVFVCEGRSESAAGLTLPQVAEILVQLGCQEALNLDGGGSSCMLINGKQTNKPSDKGEERSVPSVFIIGK